MTEQDEIRRLKELIAKQQLQPVSYTHLTLPTKWSV